MSHCFSLVVPRFQIFIWSHVCIYNLEVNWKLSRRWEGGAKGWWGVCSAGQHKYARKHVVNPKSISVRSSSFCNWDRRDTGGLTCSFWPSPRVYQPPSAHLLSSDSFVICHIYLHLEGRLWKCVPVCWNCLGAQYKTAKGDPLLSPLSLLEFLRVLPDTSPLWREARGQVAVHFHIRYGHWLNSSSPHRPDFLIPVMRTEQLP